MKHIPLMTKDEVAPEVRKRWDAMGFDLALFHVEAHVPSSFFTHLAFNGTIWEDGPDLMPRLLKEMAVSYTGVLSNSSYEWANHGTQMIANGGSQAQLDALVARDIDTDLFDDTQKLVLKFTHEVVLDGKASEPVFTAMSELFTPKQLTQLVFAICVYMMNSRLALLGGVEKGADEDYGTFFLGRK